MKKILLAAVAALAIVGCSQNEEIEKAGEKAEINFTTIVSKTTRVTPMVTDNFSTFMVNAYNTATVDMGTGVDLSTKFMTDVTATKSGEAWGINKGPFYWPMTDKIQFFAYSPIGKVTSYTATTGYPTFSYTIQAVDDQEDLLVAKLENATKTTAGDAVELKFAHILTQINFSAKLEAGVTYTVTKIEISGVNNTGTFTYGAGTETGAWSDASGDASYVYGGNYVATADKDNVVDFSTGANALMLLPQPLATDAKIAITYSAVAGGTTTFTGTKEVSLKDQEWVMGKNLRYTLELPSDATSVTFMPTVNEWGAEESGTPNKPA